MHLLQLSRPIHYLQPEVYVITPRRPSFNLLPTPILTMLKVASVLAALALSAPSVTAHDQTVLANNVGAAGGVPAIATAESWIKKYGPQVDLGYTGPLSFSHLEYARCLQEPNTTFDLAILGMPFDTTVRIRSYHP